MGVQSGDYEEPKTPEKRSNKKERSSNERASPSPSCEFSDRILSAQQLVRLKEHRYSCVCTSLFDPFLQPYWNWLVLRLPIWMAPNLITVLGLIVNVVTSLILMWYSPDCKSPVPAWALILCALGLFIYQSLDAIDGKQARRTSSSSPLGELFDHGCDSISTVFVSLGVCISCRLGVSLPFMFLQSFMAILLFYCAHWQTYVTGTLKFGLIDVTEAQIGIMIIHILTAIFGGDFWTDMNVPFTSVPFYVIYVFVALGGAIPALYSEFKTILYKGAGKNGSSIAGTSVLSPVIPFALVIAPAVIIAAKSEQYIYAESPAIYILTFGLIAAKVTNRLVVAHMTKSEMDYFDPALIGPIMLFLNQYFDCFVREKYVLWFSLILVSGELYRYSRKVCLEICDSLNIHLFKINVPEQSTLNKKGVSTSSTASVLKCICRHPLAGKGTLSDCGKCPSCSLGAGDARISDSCRRLPGFALDRGEYLG